MRMRTGGLRQFASEFGQVVALFQKLHSAWAIFFIKSCIKVKVTNISLFFLKRH